ncbi:MAG: YgiQ family radical SAM protein [Bacteroidetes bacterium]|nr:MAG: YgiQ family radical SAM protein [Bacteroidota bacterium]
MSYNQTYDITKWLPTSKKELKQRDWDYVDVIIFSGDAYVDHPSFGASVIGRIIENEDLSVAIVPQPNWKDDLRDFKKLGKPRLFFAVTSGCMDSMVNHYTANRRRRSNDAYTPGGNSGFRPDYATTVYTNILKKLYPDTPIIIGGVEASMRRLTHYDYWSDKLMPSILINSKADLLVYGMGEKPIKEIVRLLQKGVPFKNLKSIPQTAFLINDDEKINFNKNSEKIYINSHEECLSDKLKFAKNFKIIEEEANSIHAKVIIQKIDDKLVIINPQYPKVSEKEIDSYYNLPFTRLPHPRYNNKGAIPAYEMIKFSINIHRGCFGGCSFCTISAHQGKFIISRSEKSILKELEAITQMPDFKGYISDIGGPSANMYKMQGRDLSLCEKCKRPSCINPSICKNLDTSHKSLIDLYKQINNHPKIKKAFVGSGIRYDLLFDKDLEIKGDYLKYFNELVVNHVSGRLKVAPEHTSDKVLKIMRKPSFSLFIKLKNYFDKINKDNNLSQQLIPYFISSHPASKNDDMAELAIKTKNLDFKLEQVQDFTPTPMTLATVVYYSGYHPYTLEKIYSAKTKKDKLDQRCFFFWYKREYKQQIKQVLEKINRKDLIKRLFE